MRIFVLAVCSYVRVCLCVQEYCQATVADGSVGLVPMSSVLERPGVMLQPMPWFHGPITRYSLLSNRVTGSNSTEASTHWNTLLYRFEAEKILDRNQDGQFLMRTSQSTEGIYALAVS